MILEQKSNKIFSEENRDKSIGGYTMLLKTAEPILPKTR